MVVLICLVVVAPNVTPSVLQIARTETSTGQHAFHGVGEVHMVTSCSPSVAKDFDRALAILHNFWYARALAEFQEVAKADPQCAMAYWGAAMSYNHPFWDAPTPEDNRSAWALVQEGLKATKQSPRERLFLNAVAALYRDGGAGPKAARDAAYREAMAEVYRKHPSDESKLFYGLAILGTIEEGAKDFRRQAIAARLFEEVYKRQPKHPGVLHYLIHVYDDPAHAAQGLKAARAYAKAAAAVPHALHMPSHIFARLGLWEESAATNEAAWRISEEDVKNAGESGDFRDFHSLNYLQHAYLQLGRYRDASRVTAIIAGQYNGLANKTTAPDSPDLEARHVRGRTIYALPDRVAYGYFDMLSRYILETGSWAEVTRLPLVAPSRDFVAMKLQLETMAAANRKDVVQARAAAAQIGALLGEPNLHPFVRQILTLQWKEAEAVAAQAAGDVQNALARMNEAVVVEDSIFALSQPPHPAIPVHELYGKMLLEIGRPAEARKHFLEALKRTPGRPKAIYGIARVAEMQGDRMNAIRCYRELLAIWKNADPDLPEMITARKFLAAR
jgi:tetratricopeptide (TPR) repeat protein